MLNFLDSTSEIRDGHLLVRLETIPCIRINDDTAIDLQSVRNFTHRLVDKRLHYT